MKCFTFAVLTAAVVLPNHAAVAQEAEGVPDDVIKALDYFVGTWEAEGKVGEMKQTGAFRCRWGKGEDNTRCCLVGRFSYKTGEETRSGITLIGWNAAKRCIEDRGFDANGGNATLLWTIESPTHWRGDVTMVEDGKAVTAKADLIFKGSKEAVYEAETETGEVVRIVFRKVKARVRE